ncbi:SoxR reducing system RseC family protein [Halanaerobaculum tunisiense]
MKEIGEVIVDQGKVAIVKIQRHSACSKCKKNCELAKNHEQDELLVYLFPLLSLVGGYLLGQKFIIQVGEVGGIIGAIVCLILSFGLVKIIGTKMNSQPKITEIIG